MRALALDIETTGLDFTEDCIVSMSFYYKGRNRFIPLHHPDTTHMSEKGFVEEVQGIIDRTDLLIVHNAQFEYMFLKKIGVNLDNVDFFDTMYAEYLLTKQQATFPKLETLAIKYTDTEKMDIGLGEIPANEQDLDVLEEYNNKDTEVTYKIYEKQIEQMSVKMYNLCIQHSNFSKVLGSMAYNGFKIDKEGLLSLNERIRNEIEIAKNELLSYLERHINLKSPRQLSAALFGGTFQEDGHETVIKHYKKGDKEVTRKCKVDVNLKGLGFSTKGLSKTKEGHYSVSDDVITQLKGASNKQKEFVQKYKAYNKLKTLYDKYLDKYEAFMKDTGLIHASFNQTVTETGRISSSKPNIQQVPRPDDVCNVKELFISRYEGGYLVDADFSQLEWRVCAYLCQDPVMIEEIKNGIDAHKANASAAFSIPENEVSKEQRQAAKAVSFGLIYGQTSYGMSLRPDIPVNNERDAQKIIDSVYNKYKKLKEFHNKCYMAATNKKEVEIPSGRKYYYPFADKMQSKIKNYPVQGFATADIVPLMLIKAWNKLKDVEGVCLVNTVHDCIVVDCKDRNLAERTAKWLYKLFVNTDKFVNQAYGIGFNVPLTSEIEIGKNWGSMEDFI